MYGLYKNFTLQGLSGPGKELRQTSHFFSVIHILLKYVHLQASFQITPNAGFPSAQALQSLHVPSKNELLSCRL